MSAVESVDFFTDASLIPDPYPYFDHLRQRCPVLPQPGHGVAVTGHWQMRGLTELHLGFSPK
jgi:hypothetical protein